MSTITAPLTSFALAALVPDVVRSCVVLQPSPPPDPGEAPPAPAATPGIYTPIAPGVIYANLPVAPAIVDTSPDQMIGCIVTVADNPQGRLDALFPSAVDGDGVIDRATNDIWVYDGAIWNNVGPTPGPTITATTVIPPWNETLLAVARTRTKLSVNALAYALELLTEPDPITTTTALTVRSVTAAIKVPATSIALAAAAPSVVIPVITPVSITVTPFSYTGTGAEQTIELPITSSFALIRPLSSSASAGSGSFAYDTLRGSTKRWGLDVSSQEATDAQSVKSFGARNFVVGTSSQANQNTITFGGHAFAATGSSASNTDGTITTTVAVSRTYSIITYTGNGTASATIGHGLPSAPQLVIIKRLSGGTAAAVVGGPVVGDDYYMELWFSGARVSSTTRIRSTSATTITLGTDDDVNANGSNYVAYAFADVPGVSKIGTYVGDGDAGGQVISTGFDVDFLMVKGRNGGTIGDFSEWLLFDRTDTARTRVYRMAGTLPFANPTAYYELQDDGFLAAGDDVYTTINNNGATYLYLAFSRMLPNAEPAAVAFNLSAETPTVSAN